MHQLRDPQSFEMMASAFVLSPSQASYARHLNVGEAISETPQGAPIHVYPPNIIDRLRKALEGSKLPDNTTYLGSRAEGRVVSDNALTKLMVTRRVAMPIADVIPDYEMLRGVIKQDATALSTDNAADLLLNIAPFLSCANCRPLWRTRKCLHRKHVQQFRRSAQHDDFEMHLVSAIEITANKAGPWQTLSTIGPKLTAAMGTTPDTSADVFYCYLAHLTEIISHHSKAERQAHFVKYRSVVRDFHRLYQPVREEEK
jgi:hypothetical protein